MDPINSQKPTHPDESKEIKLDTPWGVKLVLALLLVADACVFPLGSSYDWASRFVLPALAICSFLAMVIKNRDLSIAFVMLVPGALLWLVSGNYVLACVWVVILSLVGGAAYLLRTMPLWMWLIMPLVSYVISLAAVGHALRALASLIFFPAAFALHNSISTAKSRTGSIAMTAAALLLSFVATGAIALYMANGHLSMDTIQTTISDYRNLFQTQIQETLDSQIEMMSGMGYDLGVSSAQLAENLVTTLFNYIPGILILTTLVIGWCVQPMSFLLHQRIDPEAPVPVTARVLTFSPVTGIVYMISQLLGFVYSFAENPVLLVFANVALALCPGLALHGLGYMFGRRALRRSGGRPVQGSSLPFIIFLVLIVMMLFGLVFAGYILVAFAFFGAYATIVTEIRKHLPKDEGPDNTAES